jgi:hypothetical protein
MYETFYSKYQMFPLKQIQDGLRIVVRDQALFVNDADWLEIGKIRQMFVGARELLQRKVLRYYETFHLLYRALDLRAEMISMADKQYESTLEEYKCDPELTDVEAEKEASADAWSSIDRQEETRVPPKAKRLLKKSGLSPKEIEKRREEFAYLGFRADPLRGSSICLNNGIRETLEAFSSDFKFARDCYAIAEQLEWFLRMVGERPPTMEKIRSGIDTLKICVICQKYFRPVRRSDVTCRDKEASKLTGKNSRQNGRGKGERKTHRFLGELKGNSSH